MRLKGELTAGKLLLFDYFFFVSQKRAEKWDERGEKNFY